MPHMLLHLFTDITIQLWYITESETRLSRGLLTINIMHHIITYYIINIHFLRSLNVLRSQISYVSGSSMKRSLTREKVFKSLKVFKDISSNYSSASNFAIINRHRVRIKAI